MTDSPATPTADFPPPSPRTGALSHLRVLDLSRVLAGPWCTQNLADMGTHVIKIEKAGEGDDTRHWGPPFLQDEAGEPTWQACSHRGIRVAQKRYPAAQPPAGQRVNQVVSAASPLRLSETPPTLRYAPPALCQHTEEVLRDYLQLSSQQLEGLRASRVV